MTKFQKLRRKKKITAEPQSQSRSSTEAQHTSVEQPMFVPSQTMSLAPDNVLAMQRQFGNQATQRILQTYRNSTAIANHNHKGDNWDSDSGIGTATQQPISIQHISVQPQRTIQRLMPYGSYKKATSAWGRRNKIKTLDTAYKSYKRQEPKLSDPEKIRLLEELVILADAYLNDPKRSESKRRDGVIALKNEIAIEISTLNTAPTDTDIYDEETPPPPDPTVDDTTDETEQTTTTTTDMSTEGTTDDGTGGTTDGTTPDTTSAPTITNDSGGSTIVFQESEADTIVVPSPWETAALQADPDIMTKHQGKKTVVKGGKKFAKSDKPHDYKLSFNDDTVVETNGEGERAYHVIKSGESVKDSSGGVPEAWVAPFSQANKDIDVYTGAAEKELSKDKTKVYEVKIGTKNYIVLRTGVSEVKHKYTIIKIGTDQYHVRSEDLYEGEAQHKETIDPLFPDGDPKPEHIRQTGLGDCYLQAFLINAATQNPNHLKNMMHDNGDGSVTVRYYHKNGAKWDPDFIKIKKSIATGATGKNLYNDGALWAHMIEKSFTVFAGQHGMYGDALTPPTNKGYGAIEGGWTYQLGGVFYGTASKEATLENMAFNTDSAKMVKANYAQIKQLYELKSSTTNPYLGGNEAVMITASANWYDTMQRMITIAKQIEAGVDVSTDYGKAIKDMREKLEAAKTATDLPANSGKDKMDIAEVATAVSKSKDYVVGTGVIGAEATANPTNGMLQRFYELLNNFKELGSDSSPNQRFIYNHHAYSVVDVSFKDSTGTEYWPSKSDLDTKKDEVLTKIDPTKTTVTLRNPHRTNTPTQNATELEAGKFNITLEQFMVSFTRLEYGKVEKS
jgi:hypothetical protein